MARKKKRRFPKRFISIDKVSRTTYLQNPKTGRLMGRKKTRVPGDLTRVRRAKEGKYSGQIFGRTNPIPVKGSKKKRGHVRRL